MSSGGNKWDTQNVGEKRDMKSEIMRKKERKSKSEKGWNREREKGRVRDRIRKIRRERESNKGRKGGRKDGCGWCEKQVWEEGWKEN